MRSSDTHVSTGYPQVPGGGNATDRAGKEAGERLNAESCTIGLKFISQRHKCTVLNSNQAIVLFFCREGDSFTPDLRVSGGSEAIEEVGFARHGWFFSTNENPYHLRAGNYGLE